MGLVYLGTHAPDGGTTAATELTSNPQLSAIISDEIDLNDIAVNPKTENLIVINSGIAATNDDIIEIDIKTGAPKVLVRATDIKTDLGTADVGFNGIGADTDGAIYLANRFGPTGDPTNHSLVAVKNPGGGAGSQKASVLASEAQIIAAQGMVDANNQKVTELRYQNSGLVVTGGGQDPPTVFVNAVNRRGSTDVAVGVISISQRQ